jgi:hypothetical protein
MTDYGMTETEFREALRRQLLSMVRVFERRYNLPHEIDILVVPKPRPAADERHDEPAVASR